MIDLPLDTVFTRSVTQHRTKQQLIDERRYQDVEEAGWGDHVVDDFCERAALEGFIIESKDVRSDTSCPQGSGSSFTCTIDLNVWKTKLALPDGLTDSGLEARVLHKGGYGHRYSHENTCYAVVDDYGIDLVQFGDPEALEIMIGLLMFELEDRRLALCRDLHAAMEKERDWLTSDECIWENLVENNVLEEEDWALASPEEE